MHYPLTQAQVDELLPLVQDVKAKLDSIEAQLNDLLKIVKRNCHA